MIEILVVVSIIALLSSVILATLQNSRVSARDAERVSDLHQIRNALELFYDRMGRYPVISATPATVPGAELLPPATAPGGARSCNTTSSAWVAFRNALNGVTYSGFKYIDVPLDPVNSPFNCTAINNLITSGKVWFNQNARAYLYISTPTGSDYDLLTNLELSDSAGAASHSLRCPLNQWESKVLRPGASLCGGLGPTNGSTGAMTGPRLYSVHNDSI